MRRRPGLQFKMLRVYSKASRLTGKILKSFWNLLKWTSNLFLLGDVLGRTSGHTQSARLQTHKSFWELRGLGLSQGGSNVWPLVCPNKIQLTAVNILAKVFSPFFRQSSLKRNQRESKTKARRDFCKRMLLNLKGGTCQHLDYEHMATSHLCHWAPIDTCLHEQTLSRIEGLGCIWQRRREAGAVAPAFGSVQLSRKRNTTDDQWQQHDGTFVKECCSMWRVELVKIPTMSICPTHIFVTKRRLILARMNKPFGELRYLAGLQRGRRSCPRIWLSAIEPKRTVSTSWQR